MGIAVNGRGGVPARDVTTGGPVRIVVHPAGPAHRAANDVRNRDPAEDRTGGLVMVIVTPGVDARVTAVPTGIVVRNLCPC